MQHRSHVTHLNETDLQRLRLISICIHHTTQPCMHTHTCKNIACLLHWHRLLWQRAQGAEHLRAWSIDNHLLLLCCWFKPRAYKKAAAAHRKHQAPPIQVLQTYSSYKHTSSSCVQLLYTARQTENAHPPVSSAYRCMESNRFAYVWKTSLSSCQSVADSIERIIPSASPAAGPLADGEGYCRGP